MSLAFAGLLFGSLEECDKPQGHKCLYIYEMTQPKGGSVLSKGIHERR